MQGFSVALPEILVSEEVSVCEPRMRCGLFSVQTANYVT
jgi:hypothetical protein